MVGQRVVVRRILPGRTGPTGGPAMTDLLGECLEWNATDCLIAPATGEPVRIPLALIVSGKPVPPRASVRQRVPARTIEGLVVDLWDDLEAEPLGEWLLRTAPPRRGRRRKRANSALAMGDPGVGIDRAQRLVRDHYAATGQPALVQVELGGEVDAALGDLGWRPLGVGDADARLASIAGALRGVDEVPDLEFVVDGPRAAARLPDGSEVRVVLHRDYLGIHELQVDPAHRRRGQGRALVAAALEWGAERGALTAWLHVETDNEPAIALYDAFGFRTHHTNRYLTPPD